jgi:hypothetical protein
MLFLLLTIEILPLDFKGLRLIEGIQRLLSQLVQLVLESERAICRTLQYIHSPDECKQFVNSLAICSFALPSSAWA